MANANVPKVELLAIGEEVLGGRNSTSNTVEIARMLGEIGITPHRHSEVGDRPADITQVVCEAVRRSQVLIVTGGLGPTTDDLTRPVVAHALGRKLVRNPDLVRDMEARFRHRNIPMPESNLVQADVPEGGMALPNSMGTAPGIYVLHEGCHVFLLPGVPDEMRALMRKEVLPRILALSPELIPPTVRKLRVVGLPESRIADLMSGLTIPQGLDVAYLPQHHEVYVIFTGDTPSVENAASEACLRLGDHVYAEGDKNMAELVLELCKTQRKTLATAESCTGGLVGKTLTDIAGSSAVYLGGVVVYSNKAKSILADVDTRMIEQHGAVSEQVAAALAEGIKRRLGADLALGITGIAGPEGGSEKKPVGTVYVALASSDGTKVWHWILAGERVHMRGRTTLWALDLVRRSLTGQWGML